MSGGGGHRKGGLATRLTQALALGVVFLMMLAATHAAPATERALPTVAASVFSDCVLRTRSSSRSREWSRRRPTSAVQPAPNFIWSCR